MRTRFQQGSIVLQRRASGKHVWLFRWRDQAGKRRGEIFGTIAQFRNRSLARAEAGRLRLQEKHLGRAQAEREGKKLFGQLIERYKQEEMPQRYSTKRSYSSRLNCHIRPKWEHCVIEDVEAILGRGVAQRGPPLSEIQESSERADDNSV